MSRQYQSYWAKKPQHEQLWRKKASLYNRLVIEIGAGQGLHAIQYSQQHPDTLYIAIERTLVKFSKMKQRLKHHPEIQNLLIYNVDAVQWLSEHINANEVDAYFILYPNPYPKAKQANKRWHYMPFMDFLIDSLKLTGTLTMASNIESYVIDAEQVFKKNNTIRICYNKQLKPDMLGRTHFEKKYLERAEPCFEIKFQKEDLSPR